MLSCTLIFSPVYGPVGWCILIVAILGAGAVKKRGHMSANPSQFAVGDRVERETGAEGVVVYLYEDRRIAGEIIAIKFDPARRPCCYAD
jgi:hypothetical protein